MSVLYIQPGGLITLDPSDKRVVEFDWDTNNLASGVTITTSVYTITPIRQVDPTEDLTIDNETILAGSRGTQARLIATTANNGDLYRVSNKITTNETPAQEKEQSYKVLVQNR